MTNMLLFDKSMDKQVHSLVRTDTSLRSRYEQNERQRKNLLSQVQQAQQRILAAPLVSSVLERVQQREHEKAVGIYEKLLGAFLSDVLPGERLINMDLYTERGAPALDIYIKKGENAPLEDAYLGTGGSVTNLLSTGLRLVALLRSGQRRFLVLDESDCWIEPALIPKYASIVQEMATTLDVQILMISHHQEHLFKDYIPYRLTMTKKSSLVGVDWSVSSDIPVWKEGQEGIRFISLKHFQSHQHTIIPLSPTVTLLQGANDIGKSAVSNALRAVFEGDNNDTLIQHHKSSAAVAIDFGPQHLLTWERFRKGKVKVSYKMLDDQGHVLHASDGTKVPDWLLEHSKIGKIDGLDVQIGQQQDPVFLLNQPPSQRAKALAIGQESGHIQEMIALDKQQTTEAKQDIKQGEKMLEQLRREQDILQKLSPPKSWQDDYNTLQENQRVTTQATQLLALWKNKKAKQAVLDVSYQDLRLPVPKNTMGGLLRTWSYLQHKEKALDTPLKVLSMPKSQADHLKDIAKAWKRAKAKEQHLAQAQAKRDIRMPVRQDKASLLLTKWRNALRQGGILSVPQTSLTPPLRQSDVTLSTLKPWKETKKLEEGLMWQLEQLNREYDELKEKIPTCPCCGRRWEDTGHTHEKSH